MDIQFLSVLISNSKQISPLIEFSGHIDGISCVSTSNLDKEKVALASFDSTLTLHDINNGKEIGKLQGHKKGAWTCDFSPINKNSIVSGGSDSTVILWDTNSNKSIANINEHKDSIYSVHFSENGKYFASCSKETICVFDINNTSKPLDKITTPRKKKEDGFIYCVNFLNEDKDIISGYEDGTILIHRISTPLSDDNTNLRIKIESDYISKHQSEEEYSQCVYNIHKFNNLKNKIGLTHSDGSVRIYSIELDNKKVKLNDKYYYFTGSVTCCDTSSDDKLIIACGKDLSSQVWELNNHKKINYTLTGHKGIISSCTFVKNGVNDTVITGSYDNKARIYKLN